MTPERRQLDELRRTRVWLRKQIAGMTNAFTPAGYDQTERSRRLDWLLMRLRDTNYEWRRLHYALHLGHKLDAKPVRLR